MTDPPVPSVVAVPIVVAPVLVVTAITPDVKPASEPAGIVMLDALTTVYPETLVPFIVMDVTKLVAAIGVINPQPVIVRVLPGVPQ